MDRVNRAKWLIGVDEAGRGPLAGPVAVGAVLVPTDFDWSQLPGVNDSKKLTEVRREMLFNEAQRLHTAKVIRCSVAMAGPEQIDRNGIAASLRRCIARATARLTDTPDDCMVLLDGLLRAPKQFRQQRTINGGDGKEKVIGLASIMAKVKRDRYMARIAAKPQFAPYDFATHKGYGTKVHRRAIEKHGLSALHRRSYCKNIIVL